MPIYIRFHCDGCNNKIDGASFLMSSLKNIVPPGWVSSDPVTHCCYCPECAKDIGLEPDNV